MPQIAPDKLEIIKRALTLQEGWDKALEAIAELDEHKATPEEIAAARDAYATDELEIDDDAMTSRGDNGHWVQAWVWMYATADDDDDAEESDLQDCQEGLVGGNA